MRKVYVIVLIVGCIIIAAYLATRFYLQADVKKNRASAPVSLRQSAAATENPDTTLDLRTLFKAKLQQLVHQSSYGLYRLLMDSMQVDVLQSSVSLYHVRMVPDAKAAARLRQLQQAPDDIFTLSFKALKIRGINLDDFITRRTIDFKSIVISGPHIEVDHQKSSKSKDPQQLTRFLQRLRQAVDKVAVGKILVEDASFISRNKAENKTMQLQRMKLAFYDILIDSATKDSKDRFLFAKNVLLSIRDYVMKTPDDLYLFKAGHISIQAPHHVMTINQLSLASKYNREQFQKKLVHRKAQFNIAIPKIKIDNIDWWRILTEGQFVADAVTIQQPNLKVYLDRTLPPPAEIKKGSFPHQLIMQLPVKLHIATMKVQNMKLAYEEYSPQTKMLGTVLFDKVMLKANNITNIQISKNSNTRFYATSRFMQQVPMQASFVFDLANQHTGAFSASINVSGFDGKLINAFAPALGLFKVEKGVVQSARATIKGNEKKATGKTLLLYNDLKLSLYEKEKDEPEKLDKRGVLGLIANAFVIKNDNPKKGDAPRQPQTIMERNPKAGFFNLVWTTTLAGILETIGANPKMAAKK